MEKLEQKHELLENEDLVDMWRKINEIVDVLNLILEKDLKDCLKKAEEEIRDSLGCNTLPEKKVYHEDNDRHTVSCIGACRSTLPEENTFHCTCGKMDCIDCGRVHYTEPKHNHSRGQAGCGECQKVKFIQEGIKELKLEEKFKEQKEKELIRKHSDGFPLVGKTLSDFLKEYKEIQ